MTFRSGFVTLVGRPNVGKSTLCNALVGAKVSIVTATPQTTRTQVRAVRTTPGSQIVLLDTPGVHKPRSLLGERANERALTTLGEVDLICFVVDAAAEIGAGDRFVAARLAEVSTPVVLVANKTDATDPGGIARALADASGLGDFAAFVPVSARTGDGCDRVLAEIEARMPEGPQYYPADVVGDAPPGHLAAEFLREQLMARLRDEVPHSVTVTADEAEERRTRSGEELLALVLTVRVERESQKGIVIGRGGSRLREAGSEARRELEALLGVRVHLETRVRVDPDWSRRAGSLDRLGL